MSIKTEDEIVSKWQEKEGPKVSIVCLTYNQAKYIGKAVDGFLNQNTDFPFEIIIHDDASEDDTVVILDEYKEKYPKLIKIIKRKENIYSKEGFLFVESVFSLCGGDYIALCEGDDYWIDANKIQKQYELMELNKKCAICIHNAKVINLFDKSSYPFNAFPIRNKLGSKDVLMRSWFSPTASFFIRKSMLDFPRCRKVNLDISLLYNCSRRGFVYYVNDVMSVYRYGAENSLTLSSADSAILLYRKKINFYKYAFSRGGVINGFTCGVMIAKVYSRIILKSIMRRVS